MLEEAETAQLILAVPNTLDRFRFTHALVRETLYEGLPTTRRARMHWQVGEALEALYARDPGPRLAELAHHFVQAVAGGAADTAVAYCRRAGDAALAMLAYEEAVSHFQRAVQIAEGQAAMPEEGRAELLLALGDAQQHAGEVPAARASFERAADLARRLDAPALFARAALGYGGAGVETGLVNERLLHLLDEALGMLGDAQPAVRVRLLGRMAMELYYSPERQRRAALSTEALTLARQLDDPATLAFALNARCLTLWEPEHIEERLAVSAALVQAAETAGDRERILQGQIARIPDLLEVGDIAGAKREIETLARLAADLRQPLYLWHAERLRGAAAYLDGDFAEMERRATEALRIAERAQIRGADMIFVSQIQFLRRDQGRLAEMEEPIRAIMAAYPLMTESWRFTLANVYAQAGRMDEARREIDDLATTGFSGIGQTHASLAVCVLFTEALTAAGHIHGAAILYERLLPFADRLIVNGASANFYGSASHSLGMLAATVGRLDAAAHHFEDALAVNSRVGVRPLLARTQSAYAAALLARGSAEDRARARELAAQALTTATALGMPRVAEQTRTVQDQLAHTLGPHRPVVRPDGLTAREVEVLRLLAGGLSNREIAERLVVTVNTVERHLVSIYSKIGVHGRAAAVAYALRHSLT